MSDVGVQGLATFSYNRGYGCLSHWAKSAIASEYVAEVELTH